jgi:hypothetical protein
MRWNSSKKIPWTLTPSSFPGGLIVGLTRHEISAGIGKHQFQEFERVSHTLHIHLCFLASLSRRRANIHLGTSKSGAIVHDARTPVHVTGCRGRRAPCHAAIEAVGADVRCFFWIVPLYFHQFLPRLTYCPDDGGSTDLWNVGKLIPVYTAPQTKRKPAPYSPPSEPQAILV